VFNLSNPTNASVSRVARASCNGTCSGTIETAVVPMLAQCSASSVFVPAHTLVAGELVCGGETTLDITQPDGATFAYGCGPFQYQAFQDETLEFECKCRSAGCFATLAYTFDALPPSCAPFSLGLGKKDVLCRVTVPANSTTQFFNVCWPTCRGETSLKLTDPSGSTTTGAACSGPCTYASYNATVETVLEVHQSCSPPLTSSCASRTAYVTL